MTFVVCPHCQRGFEHLVSPRICADCAQPIGRHGKWKFVQRDGITTIVHKDCFTPNGGPGFKEKT